MAIDQHDIDDIISEQLVRAAELRLDSQGRDHNDRNIKLAIEEIHSQMIATALFDLSRNRG